MAQQLPELQKFSSSLRPSPAKEEARRIQESQDPDIPEELKNIYAKLKDAEENFGDMEVRDALLEKAMYFLKTNQKERALDSFAQVIQKSVGVDMKLDVMFIIIRAAFDWNDLPLLTKYMQSSLELMEEGGDWEHKNKLKVYQGLYFCLIRQFKQAANNFLDVVATYNCTEMLSYEQYMFYTIVTSVVALNRPTIREKLVKSPEVFVVLRENPLLNQYLNSLYKCQYKEFYQSFAQILDLIQVDRFLKNHYNYYIRQMRIVVYRQYIEPYKTVTLKNIATSFGVSEEFIDLELSEFISAGYLSCKIDKVNKTVENQMTQQRSLMYGEILKQGDVLINRIQKLARLVQN